MVSDQNTSSAMAVTFQILPKWFSLHPTQKVNFFSFLFNIIGRGSVGLRNVFSFQGKMHNIPNRKQPHIWMTDQTGRGTWLKGKRIQIRTFRGRHDLKALQAVLGWLFDTGPFEMKNESIGPFHFETQNDQEIQKSRT
jgi:hypothetical protein